MSIIEIKNLSKIFSDKNANSIALSNVNLQIEEGDVFGIIGLSGAGKSTLVRCINALETPTSGEILFCGENVCTATNGKKREIRKNIAMIFQGFNLLEQRMVLKNVTFPLELIGIRGEAARKKAIELLARVGLKDKQNAYPSQLSGGQKQRVAIARALATDPKVLLCDEATSALDPSTTDSILQLLKDLNSELGITIVVITHEMRIVEKICNKVAVLSDGVLVESGLTEQVFYNPQTQIAKQLLYPVQSPLTFCGGQKLRLVFDGESYDKPLLASMVLDCKVMVNVLYADTKTLDNKTYGQMIIEIPSSLCEKNKICGYLAQNRVNFKEINGCEQL